MHFFAIKLVEVEVISLFVAVHDNGTGDGGLRQLFGLVLKVVEDEG